MPKKKTQKTVQDFVTIEVDTRGNTIKLSTLFMAMTSQLTGAKEDILSGKTILKLTRSGKLSGIQVEQYTKKVKYNAT